MGYQVLARKWRPGKFSELVGQEHVVKAISNALDNNRLHHAYLFTGTRGVGKTTIARIFARSLNCEEGMSSNPCGKCNSCIDIEQGKYVDLIEIDAASRTKVEDTREILDNVQYRPSRGEYKVYLIDEVHMLSKHSFNALLKTLEEPPPHIKFLLATTDPQKLPITILSRCLQFNLKALTREQISGQLQFILNSEQLSFEKSALALLARSAHGSMRDALSLTDQAIAQGNGQVNANVVTDMLGLIDTDQISKLTAAILDKDKARALQLTEELSLRGADFKTALAELMSVFHQVALTQFIPEACKLETSQARQVYSWARAVPPELVQLYYQIALQGRKDLQWAHDGRMGFEMVVMRMMAFAPERLKSDVAEFNEHAEQALDHHQSQPLTGLTAMQSGSVQTSETLKSDRLSSESPQSEVKTSSEPETGFGEKKTELNAETPDITSESPQIAPGLMPEVEHTDTPGAKAQDDAHVVKTDDEASEQELVAGTQSDVASVKSEDNDASVLTQVSGSVPEFAIDPNEVESSVIEADPLEQALTSEMLSVMSMADQMQEQSDYQDSEPDFFHENPQLVESDTVNSFAADNLATEEAEEDAGKATESLLSLMSSLKQAKTSEDKPKPESTISAVPETETEAEKEEQLSTLGKPEETDGSSLEPTANHVSVKQNDEAGSNYQDDQYLNGLTATPDSHDNQEKQPSIDSGAWTEATQPTDVARQEDIAPWDTPSPIADTRNEDTTDFKEGDAYFSAEGFISQQQGQSQQYSQGQPFSEDSEQRAGSPSSRVPQQRYPLPKEHQPFPQEHFAVTQEHQIAASAIPESVSGYAQDMSQSEPYYPDDDAQVYQDYFAGDVGYVDTESEPQQNPQNWVQDTRLSEDFEIPYRINGKKVTKASQLDTWSQLIEQSGLGALNKQLALNSNYFNKGETVELIVSRTQEHLFSETCIKSIEESLSTVIHHPIKLVAKLGDVIDTPSAVQKAIKDMRQHHAHKTIKEDSTVAQLCQQFGGTVLQQTIKPR